MYTNNHEIRSTISFQDKVLYINLYIKTKGRCTSYNITHISLLPKTRLKLPVVKVRIKRNLLGKTRIIWNTDIFTIWILRALNYYYISLRIIILTSLNLYFTWAVIIHIILAIKLWNISFFCVYLKRPNIFMSLIPDKLLFNN